MTKEESSKRLVEASHCRTSAEKQYYSSGYCLGAYSAENNAKRAFEKFLKDNVDYEASPLTKEEIDTLVQNFMEEVRNYII